MGDTDSAVDDAFVHILSDADMAAASWGIQLTGESPAFDVAANRDWYVPRFTPTFSNRDTRYSLVTSATEGHGAWQRVAMDEYFAQWGNEGTDTMADVPPRAREVEVVTDAKYSACVYRLDDRTSSFLSSSDTPGSIIVYLELDSSDELTDGDIGMEAMVVTDVVANTSATDFDQ
jgi:hypothetical protein